MSTLQCDIVTPSSKLFSEEVRMVIVPGVKGEMGFLEGHEPLVSLLSDGVARVERELGAEKQRFVIQGGYVEVTGKKVIILADRALPVEDIDVAEAREKLAALESQLSELSAEEIKRSVIPSKIDWYKAKIRAVGE